MAPVGNRLFLVGGAMLSSTGFVMCNKNVECYSPTTDSWTTLSTMLQPRAEAGCAVLENKIYIIGGYDWDHSKRLSSAEVYDVEEDIWTPITDMEIPLTGIACCATVMNEQCARKRVSFLDDVNGSISRNWKTRRPTRSASDPTKKANYSSRLQISTLPETKARPE